ncbi:MAG: hypothetical protein KKB31_02885 [Nanoarchaeota archaeon]|nr:hypothetical protein [Nanoarchaeota archaeon]
MVEKNNSNNLIEDLAEAYSNLARADPTNSLLEMATVDSLSVLVLDQAFGMNYRQKGLPARLRAYFEDIKEAISKEEPRD